MSSACESSLNTGIQRVIRNLYRELSNTLGDQLIPVVWDNARNHYFNLSDRELLFLKDPFQNKKSSVSRPRSNWFKKQGVRFQNKLWRTNNRRIDLGSLAPIDIFWIPEIFRDNRVAYFNNTITSCKKVALFYDAISWKHPKFSPGNRTSGFEKYMNELSRFQIIYPISHESQSHLQQYWQQNNIVNHAKLTTHSLPTDKPEKLCDVAERKIRTPMILCVGTLELRKNYITLLKAAEKLWSTNEKFHLVIIGRELKGQSQTVIDKIKTLKSLGYSIAWLKHVDEDTLIQHYKDCTFTVFPSLCEGYGLPIVESLQHRKPCICFNKGAIAETATGGGTLTLDVSDTDELANGILNLLNDHDFYEKLQQEIEFRSFKSWETYANELLADLWKE